MYPTGKDQRKLLELETKFKQVICQQFFYPEGRSNWFPLPRHPVYPTLKLLLEHSCFKRGFGLLILREFRKLLICSAFSSFHLRKYRCFFQVMLSHCLQDLCEPKGLSQPSGQLHFSWDAVAQWGRVLVAGLRSGDQILKTWSRLEMCYWEQLWLLEMFWVPLE